MHHGPVETPPGLSPPGSSRRYERHQPECTALYPIVEQHLATLRDELQRHETTLPRFVLTEFEDYLRCGRLEYGSMRRIPAPHPSGDLRSCKSAILPIGHSPARCSRATAAGQSHGDTESRYHGVFAPSSPMRRAIVPTPTSARRTLKSTRQPARLRAPIPDFPKPPTPRQATAPFSASDSLDSSEHASNKRRDEGVLSAHLPDRTVEKARCTHYPLMALKDPKSGNLDRIQIVKGWLDGAGKQHEKIYDVAWSVGREIGADGKLPVVGNTVDLKTATYTDAIGAAQLAIGWTDPDFKPDERAFYYARVLEIPTPRWTTYDAVRQQMPPLTTVPANLQERAWSSPIWYSPI